MSNSPDQETVDFSAQIFNDIIGLETKTKDNNDTRQKLIDKLMIAVDAMNIIANPDVKNCKALESQMSIISTLNTVINDQNKSQIDVIKQKQTVVKLNQDKEQNQNIAQIIAQYLNKSNVEDPSTYVHAKTYEKEKEDEQTAFLDQTESSLSDEILETELLIGPQTERLSVDYIQPSDEE